ncbi:hypothetical protein RMATCC62417_14296 [Rhizopus microsporus]|nr:hypothetical protein RMATCC62417_14296 [Rhizopus microsporus]
MQPITSRPASEHNVDSRDKKRQKRNRACDLCRRKKTRCDHDPAYPNIACSSCRNYEKECTFSEPTKKRGPSKGYVEGLEGRLKRVEELLVNMLQDMPPNEIADVTAELEKDSDAQLIWLLFIE